MGLQDKIVENRLRLAGLVITITAIFLKLFTNQDSVSLIALILGLALLFGCYLPRIRERYPMIIRELPKLFPIVFFTVILTFILSGFFSFFPLPAPAVDIIQPVTDKYILVPGLNPDGKYNGTTFDVTFKVHPGWYRDVVYDWEVTKRAIKDLNWDPKLWLMIRDSNEWDPVVRVDNYANGSLVAQVPLYSPNMSFDIELFSLNARDDMYVSSYLETVKTMKGYPKPIVRPNSAKSIAMLRVETYENASQQVHLPAGYSNIAGSLYYDPYWRAGEMAVQS